MAPDTWARRGHQALAGEQASSPPECAPRACWPRPHAALWVYSSRQGPGFRHPSEHERGAAALCAAEQGPGRLAHGGGEDELSESAACRWPSWGCVCPRLLAGAALPTGGAF